MVSCPHPPSPCIFLLFAISFFPFDQNCALSCTPNWSQSRFCSVALRLSLVIGRRSSVVRRPLSNFGASVVASFSFSSVFQQRRDYTAAPSRETFGTIASSNSTRIRRASSSTQLLASWSLSVIPSPSSFSAVRFSDESIT